MAEKRDIVKKSEIVNGFFKKLREGQKWLCDLADYYVKAIKQSADIEEMIIKEGKGHVTLRFLRRLEDVGRRKLHYKLLTGEAGRHTAKIRKLPYKDQEKVIDGVMYECWTVDDSQMMVCLRDAEEWQAKQMFANGNIRTPAEQKQWIEGEKIKAQIGIVEHYMPVEIRKKDVLVKEAMTSLTHEEWKRIALQLP